MMVAWIRKLGVGVVRSFHILDIVWGRAHQAPGDRCTCRRKRLSRMVSAFLCLSSSKNRVALNWDLGVCTSRHTLEKSLELSRGRCVLLDIQERCQVGLWTREFGIQGRDWGGVINTGVLTLCVTIWRKSPSTEHGVYQGLRQGVKGNQQRRWRRSSEKGKKKARCTWCLGADWGEAFWKGESSRLANCWLLKIENENWPWDVANGNLWCTK